MGGSSGGGGRGNKDVTSGSIGSRSIGGSKSKVPGKKPSECDIDFRVDVFGPVPDRVNQVLEGDVLDIVLDKSGSSFVVAVNLPSGKRLGTIDAGCSHLPILVKCLQEGEGYKAEIINIDGSQVNIRVYKSD